MLLILKRESGMAGFNALFVDRIPRKHGWTACRGLRGAHLPTCEQAEVLYPSRISLELLRRIYVKTGEQHDAVCGFLQYYRRGRVEVVIDPAKFLGAPN